MKKIFALVLALVLTAALAVTCFAANAEGLDDGENATNDVKVSYQAGSAAGAVYSVDVVFDDMTFTYIDTVMGTWNPEEHDYDGTVDAHWNKTSANITVTNHSNAAIDVTVTFNENNEYTGNATAAITAGATMDLESAVGTEVDQAPEGTATLTIGGTGKSGETNSVIGTITVRITAAA